MIRNVVLCFALVGYLVTLFGAQNSGSPMRVWEKHGRGFVFESFEVAPEGFSIGALETFATQRLRKLGTAGLIVMRFYRGARSLHPPPVHSEWTYEGWLQWRERYRDAEPVFAEVVSLPIGAVLRMPAVAQDPARKVLRERDPLVLTGDGYEAEILYIGQIELEDPGAHLPIFVRTTGEINRELATQIWSNVRTRLPEDVGLGVLIRNDVWFAGEGTVFPYVYPFEAEDTPPTPEEWHKSGTWSCAYWSRGFSCR